jgi:hypothetical protein
MSDFTLEELISSQTVAQVKASVYAIAESIGISTTSWVRLSPLRSVFAIVAQIFSGYTSLSAAATRARFLELAGTGDLLTKCGFYTFNVVRTPASYATGDPVVVDNLGGGLYTYAAHELLFLNSTTLKTYWNTAAVTINPLETGVEIDVEAVEVGSGSNAAPGQIDAFVSANPLLSVTNPGSIVGDDLEEASDFIARCRAKQGALSPGGAALGIFYVATTPALNGGLSGIRCRVRAAEGNGTIRVVVASAAGAVSGTTGDDSTDLGKLFAAINAQAITSGYTLLLSSASTVSVAGSGTVYVDTSSGLSSADAVAAALAAITAKIPTVPIGGVDTGSGGVVLYRALEAAAVASNPGILEFKLTVEADTALAETEVAILGAAVITAVQVET